MPSIVKSNLFWGRAAGAVALATIATGAIGLPAKADLIGQCRQTNKPTPVYETRGSATPTPTATLPTDTKVLLSDNGSGGIIAISTPRSGFIPAANLKMCVGAAPTPTPTPTPTPVTSKCRQVLNPPEGLVIRQSASTSSSIVGGVAVNSQVQLSTNPATLTVAGNRNWIEIASPAQGWISNGLVGSKGNLIYCR
jgi:hypothetical protein